MAQKTDWLDGYDPVAEGEQDKFGIDLESLRYNLRLSVDERFEQHRRAVANYFAIRDAGISARLKQAS